MDVGSKSQEILDGIGTKPQEDKDGKEQYSFIRGFGFTEDGQKESNYQKFCKYHQYDSK